MFCIKSQGIDNLYNNMQNQLSLYEQMIDVSLEQVNFAHGSNLFFYFPLARKNNLIDIQGAQTIPPKIAMVKCQRSCLDF
jgi:hypothetical protein